MSEEEGSFGMTIAEKFFGFILIIVGALATYFTYTSTEALGAYSRFFGFLSIIIIVLGLFLIIAKTE